MAYMTYLTITKPHFRLSDYKLDIYDSYTDEEKYKLLSAYSNGLFPLSKEQVPTDFYLKDRGSLRDTFITKDGFTIVSDTFKQLAEEFDPGVHQFFDVSLHEKSGERVAGSYYVMNVTARKDSIVWEKTPHVKNSETRYVPSIYKGDLHFLETAETSPHLWREVRYDTELFISEAFRVAAEQRGLKMFKLR